MLSGIAWVFIFLYQPTKHGPFAYISNLCVDATDNITIITSGFILIVLRIILLWLVWPYYWFYSFDYITLVILLIILLLIILLWCCHFWLYYFDCFNHIAGYICAWKWSLFLILFNQSFLLQDSSSLKHNLFHL